MHDGADLSQAPPAATIRLMTRFTRWTLAIVLASAAASLYAQDAPHEYTIWRSSELAERALPYRADPTGMAGGGIGRMDGRMAILVRRDKTGESESHANASDLMMVVDGEATLVVGGAITGLREGTQPGEPRGTGVQGGEEKEIRAGDIIHLGPGTVHWVKVPEGGRLTYFLVKLARQ